MQFCLSTYVNDILMQNEIDHLWTTFNTLRCLRGNLIYLKWKGAGFTMSNLIQWGEKMSDKLNLKKDEGNDKGLCVINP
jgi:hypothetical protein